MSDPAADPHYVGCSIPEEKVKERLNSSASVSDLSEATSDMSLSTSPGSDNPSHQQKGFMNMSVSPASTIEASCYKSQPPGPKKRPIVRQLSSNPYLASSEMSPSEDHPLIMGSHSYAAGDSKLYSNGNTFSDNTSEDYYKMSYSQRAISYPLTSDYLEGSDSSNDEKEGGDGQDTVVSDVEPEKDTINRSKVSNPRHEKNIEEIHHELNTHSQDINGMVDSLGITSVESFTETKYSAYHQHHQNHQQQGKKDQGQQYYNHQNEHHTHHQSQQQQHHQFFRNTNMCSGNNTNGNSLGNKMNGFSWNSNQNALYSAESAPSAFVRARSQHYQSSTNSTQPKSREINTWGHFHKPSESHYKYRRSHYNSSDSDEEHNTANNRMHIKQTNTNSRLTSACKLCKPSCKCKHPNSNPSLSQSPCMHRNNVATSQPLSTSEKKRRYQNGVKPEEFKDRFQLMKRWFSECNDGQKNIVLKGLLSLCELPQLHLLSVHMSKELHHGCPSNCEDIITWLPRDLATKLMSYLDPVSLCRSAQVCKVWRELAEDQSLWRRFCCQTKWRLSKAAEHKQVISHMSPEGSIQWKNVFAERFRLRNNWLKGRCTVRTFEGHLQGISCVQFDDSRIVSGSSDKTIKVWNMRTNAPWSVQTLMGHHGTVRCLHLDGNRLVSGSCDTTIKVWDLSTQDSWSSIACKVTMTGHSDTVRCLQADDDKVISGSYDKTLKIWDLKSGELRRTLRGHQASVLCVHFSETKIVSGSADKTIKVWNYEGRCIMTLQGHQDAVTCLMFDSTRIVSGSLDHNLKFWDIHSGECLNTIDWKKAEGHTDVVRCLQADSWRVVSAADDKTIKVWNLVTGERLVTLRNHTDGVTCLQFNDFIIVSGSYDKSVKLWDFSSC